MKINRISKIIFAILLLLLVLGIGSKTTYKTYISNISYNKNNIDKILEEILYNETEEFSENRRNSIEKEIKEIIQSNNDEEILSKAYFISAYIKNTKFNMYETIEKYKKAISYFNEDTSPKLIIRTYFEISECYLSLDDYDKSSVAFDKVVKLGEEKKLKEDIIKFSIIRAKHLGQITDGTNKAVGLMESTLEIAKDIDYNQIEDVYLKLGISYWYVNRSIEAINCKLNALAITLEKKLDKKSLEIMIDIGIDYLYTENYTEAIKYLEQSLEYHLENPLEDADLKSYALLNLVQAYTITGEYESSKESFKELERYINKLENSKAKNDTKTVMYVNKADLENKLNNPEEALRLLELASNRYNSSKNFTYYDFDIQLAQIYGDTFYILKDYEGALKYHKQAERLADERGIEHLKDLHFDRIYLDYKASGDVKNALLYLEKKDNVNEEEKKNQNLQYSQYLLKKFESEQNLKKIEELEISRKKMTILYVSLVLIIIITFFIIGFIYTKNKEIRRLNCLLRDLSVTDDLTNIANRRAMEEYLDINWDYYKNLNKPVSIVMMDVDYFKRYNDNYGHVMGDKVLGMVANTIKESCRQSDFVARYGGEEFIIIMLNTDKEEVIKAVERINQNIYDLNINHEYSDVSDRITVSVGITTAFVKEDDEYYDYIKKADEALYIAKEKGRNQYVHLYKI